MFLVLRCCVACLCVQQCSFAELTKADITKFIRTNPCLKHLNYHLLGIPCGPVVKSGRIPALHAALMWQRKRRWSWVQIPPGPLNPKFKSLNRTTAKRTLLSYQAKLK